MGWPDQNASDDEQGMPGWRRSLGEAGPYLGLGMQIALSMALFVGLGYGIDVWLGTLPWGTVAGAVVGMVVLFYHLLRVLDEMNRASDQKRKQQQSSSLGRREPGDQTPP
jgi:hypothetical protein